MEDIENVDPQDIQTMANNKKLWLNMRNIFPHPYTLEDAVFYKSMDYAPNLRWAIHYDGDFVGMIGIHKQQDVYAKNLEIGYWIGEPHWNKGIATIAVKTVCDFVFKNLDVKRIFAGVFDYNPASAKVLEKARFEREGVFKKAVYKEGKYLNELRYGLIRENHIS